MKRVLFLAIIVLLGIANSEANDYLALKLLIANGVAKSIGSFSEQYYEELISFNHFRVTEGNPDEIKQIFAEHRDEFIGISKHEIFRPDGLIDKMTQDINSVANDQEIEQLIKYHSITSESKYLLNDEEKKFVLLVESSDLRQKEAKYAGLLFKRLEEFSVVIFDNYLDEIKHRLTKNKILFERKGNFYYFTQLK